MKKIQRSALVPFTPQQMFDLVNDVAKYPLFLPWCHKAEIGTQSDEHMEASLHISKGPINKAFTTLNRLIPHQRIEMRLKQGPFKHLEGIWQFERLNELTQVSFNLSFEFQNPLLAMTLGPVFQHIAQSMVQAFTARANEVYASNVVA